MLFVIVLYVEHFVKLYFDVFVAVVYDVGYADIFVQISYMNIMNNNLLNINVVIVVHLQLKHPK